jgi:hypothetical protein
MDEWMDDKWDGWMDDDVDVVLFEWMDGWIGRIEAM